MATVTTVTYATNADLVLTTLQSLTDTSIMGTLEVSNVSNGYVDVLVGGVFAVSTTAAAGDTIDVYAYGSYDVDTAHANTGGIGTTHTGIDEVLTLDTEIILKNLPLLVSVATETDSLDYHWGPVSLASAFGGVVPTTWGIIVHNQSDTTLDSSGNIISYTGITYTNT